MLRDDFLAGGTKRRVLQGMIPAIPQNEIVYAGHAYGYAALAIALAAQSCGKKLHVFYPSPQVYGVEVFDETIKQPNVTFSIEKGLTKQHEVVQAATAYAHVRDAYFMPIGCATDEFRAGLVEIARSLHFIPDEVWCLSGSGLLTSALSQAWPNASINGVSLGMPHLKIDRARVTVWEAPERPEQAASALPPYPSALYYDAKIWRFVQEHGSPDALIWNVS